MTFAILKLVRIHARPSDALNVALRAKAPIGARREVLAAIGTTAEGTA